MIRFALIAASVLGFALTAAVGNLLLPLLRTLAPPEGEGQDAPRPQRRDGAPDEDDGGDPPTPGPRGLPAMGGLCFIIGALAAVGVGWAVVCLVQPELLGGGLTGRLILGLGCGFLLGAAGLMDDLARLRPRQVLGLRTGPRLALEGAAAAAASAALWAGGAMPTGLRLPAVGYVELGAAAAPLWALLLLALAEPARLSGHADGAAAGAAFVAMLGLMGAETVLGFFPLAVLPAALAGALMAFLLWNFYPARLLPGSVGCLFLAGAVGGIPLSIGRADLALALALPFWAEGLAALLQGAWRRWKGRPLFKAGSLSLWLQKRGGAVSAFYVFCALALLGVLAALRAAQL